MNLILGELSVHQMDDFLTQRRPSGTESRMFQALGCCKFQCICRNSLRLKAVFHHAFAHGSNGQRVLELEELQSGRFRRIKALFALTVQHVSHQHGDMSEINLHGAWFLAFLADRAVVGNVSELGEMLQRNTAARLLFVQECFQQE
ncbi:unknown [Proteobacteria bacterium CAG:139]|nr:unknown [Proteobacteria bacterium CAG:139]